MPKKTLPPKKITITFNIPGKYKYIAWQPYGDLICFTKKPVVAIKEWEDENLNLVDCWGYQVGQLEILDSECDIICNLNINKKMWRYSLRKI